MLFSKITAYVVSVIRFNNYYNMYTACVPVYSTLGPQVWALSIYFNRMYILYKSYIVFNFILLLLLLSSSKYFLHFINQFLPRVDQYLVLFIWNWCQFTNFIVKYLCLHLALKIQHLNCMVIFSEFKLHSYIEYELFIVRLEISVLFKLYLFGHCRKR